MENLSQMFPKDLVPCFSLQDNSCLFRIIFIYFSFEDLVSSLISSLIVNYIVTPWIEKKLKTQHQFLSFLLTFLITYLLEKLFPRYVSILLSFICRFAWKSMGKSLMKTAHLVLNNSERIIFSIFPSFLEESELEQSLFIPYLKSIALVLFRKFTIKTVMISDPTRLIGLLLLIDRSKSEMKNFTTDVVTVTMDKNEVAFIMERIGMGEAKGTTNEGEGVIEDCICMGCEEFSALFRENEPCLDEVKEAFSVFDQNRDGLFDAGDLQRVLIALRMGEGTDIDACTLMVEQYDRNRDGKIDFSDFCRLLEPWVKAGRGGCRISARGG